MLEQIEFTWDGAVLAEQAHTDGVANGPRLADRRVMVWDYEPGTFRPLVQRERSQLRNAPQQWFDEQFYSIVTDIVGTPTELINIHGGIAWYHRTTLWGITTDQSRTGAYTPLRFPGQYADPETGFNYNFQRHYDPASARYAGTDPLGLAGGFDPHSYVWNPYAWIDPLGLKKCDPDRPKHFEKAKENLAEFNSIDEAREAAIQYSGLTDKKVPHVQKLGPWEGFYSGEMSPDGKRGWRVDWDDKKGVHINWWDHTGGRKRRDWWYGANQVPSSSYDDYMAVLEELNPL